MKKQLVLFLAIGLGVTACSGRTVSSDVLRKERLKRRTWAHQQSLSAAGEKSCGPSWQAGDLADLQWPNFSENSDAVKEFYDLSLATGRDGAMLGNRRRRPLRRSASWRRPIKKDSTIGTTMA